MFSKTSSPTGPSCPFIFNYIQPHADSTYSRPPESPPSPTVPSPSPRSFLRIQEWGGQLPFILHTSGSYSLVLLNFLYLGFIFYPIHVLLPCPEPHVAYHPMAFSQSPQHRFISKNLKSNMKRTFQLYQYHLTPCGALANLLLLSCSAPSAFLSFLIWLCF